MAKDSEGNVDEILKSQEDNVREVSNKGKTSESEECMTQEPKKQHFESNSTLSALHNEIDKVASCLSQVSLSENELQLKIEKLQCPFNWKLSDMQQKHEKTITRSQEKEEEMDAEEGPVVLLRHLGVKLVLCYEFYQIGNIPAAYDEQKLVEDTVNQCKQEDIKEGLVHISKSCLAYLHFQTGSTLEAKNTISEIVPYEQLDASNRACIFGMKAMVFMEYGYEGTRQSVSYIEEALLLDPSSAEWNFLLGKSLGRIRRVNAYNEIPDKRELQVLEKAFEISSSPSYCIFLAQAYRETAYKAFSLNRGDKRILSVLKPKLDNMNAKSEKYYRQALTMAPDSPRINIRCAVGFIKLPKPYQDTEQAKICLEKALKLAPNNAMAHHWNGKLHERFHNIQAARMAYEIAGQKGAYGGYMDLLRLEFKQDQNYDPSEIFKTLLDDFTEQPYVHETLCQKGSYSFFKKNDLKTAVNFWLQVMDENAESEKMKTHIPVCTDIKIPFNLIKVAVDEVQLALKRKDLTPEEEELFRKVISIYEDTDLLKGSPKPHRKRILGEAVYENHLQHGMERQRKGHNWLQNHGRGRGESDSARQGHNYGRENHHWNANRGSSFNPRGKYAGTGRVGFQNFGDKGSKLPNTKENWRTEKREDHYEK